MNGAHLPNELWLQIISQLDFNGDLASLRLCNRVLCNLITPLLFHDLELDFAKCYTSTGGVRTRKAIERLCSLIEHDGLNDGYIYDGEFEFLSFVTELRIIAVYDVVELLAFRKFAAKFLPLLIPLIRNLKKVGVAVNLFYVNRADVTAVMGILASKCDDDLEIQLEVRSCTADPVRCLPVVPNVTKLRLLSYGDVSDAVSEALMVSTRLKELELKYTAVSGMDSILDKISAGQELGLQRLSLEYSSPPCKPQNLRKLENLKEVAIGGTSHYLAGSTSSIEKEKAFWGVMVGEEVQLERVESVDISEELLRYLLQPFVGKRLKILRLNLNRTLQATVEGVPATTEQRRLGETLWKTVLPRLYSSLEHLSVHPLADMNGELSVNHWRLHRQFKLPSPWDILENPQKIESATLKTVELFVNHCSGYFARLMDIVARCSALEELKGLLLRNITQKSGPGMEFILDDAEMFRNALAEIVHWRAGEGEGGGSNFQLKQGVEMTLRIFSFYNKREEVWRFWYLKENERWWRRPAARVISVYEFQSPGSSAVL